MDQAASANQALLRKLDQRSQNSGLDRGVRLRAGGDLEETTATAPKFTQHFTSFKCQRVRESTSKSATYDDTIQN